MEISNKSASGTGNNVNYNKSYKLKELRLIDLKKLEKEKSSTLLDPRLKKRKNRITNKVSFFSVFSTKRLIIPFVIFDIVFTTQTRVCV